MAGVKGRSGGARPGAGRKKKAAAPLAVKPAAGKKGAAVPLADIGKDGFDPRPALEQVAQGLLDPSPAQMKALVALMPYVHGKRGEGGKKDEAGEKAKKAARGKFGAAPPPLALVKRA